KGEVGQYRVAGEIARRDSLGRGRDPDRDPDRVIDGEGRTGAGDRRRTGGGRPRQEEVKIGLKVCFRVDWDAMKSKKVQSLLFQVFRPNRDSTIRISSTTPAASASWFISRTRSRTRLSIGRCPRCRISIIAAPAAANRIPATAPGS